MFKFKVTLYRFTSFNLKTQTLNLLCRSKASAYFPLCFGTWVYILERFWSFSLCIRNIVSESQHKKYQYQESWSCPAWSRSHMSQSSFFLYFFNSELNKLFSLYILPWHCLYPNKIIPGRCLVFHNLKFECISPK